MVSISHPVVVPAKRRSEYNLEDVKTRRRSGARTGGAKPPPPPPIITRSISKRKKDPSSSEGSAQEDDEDYRPSGESAATSPMSGTDDAIQNEKPTTSQDVKAKTSEKQSVAEKDDDSIQIRRSQRRQPRRESVNKDDDNNKKNSTPSKPHCTENDFAGVGDLLKENPDFIALKSTLGILSRQQRIARDDIIKLQDIKNKSLIDQELFVEKLKKEGHISGAPKMQSIARIPIIPWEKYGIEDPCLTKDSMTGYVNQHPGWGSLQLFKDNSGND